MAVVEVEDEADVVGGVGGAFDPDPFVGGDDLFVPSFSALPSLRRSVLMMSRWSNHLSSRASSAGGRGTAAIFFTVAPKAPEAWMN